MFRNKLNYKLTASCLFHSLPSECLWHTAPSVLFYCALIICTQRVFYPIPLGASTAERMFDLCLVNMYLQIIGHCMVAACPILFFFVTVPSLISQVSNSSPHLLSVLFFHSDICHENVASTFSWNMNGHWMNCQGFNRHLSTICTRMGIFLIT